MSGTRACVVPEGLRISRNAFPTAEAVGFLIRRPRRRRKQVASPPRGRGVTREQLRSFVGGVTEPVGASMILRRVSTIVLWMERTNLLREVDGRFFLSRHIPESVGIVDYGDSDEQLAPRRHDLSEYNAVERRVRRAREFITAQINDAARERAHDSHRMLTNLVAEKVRNAGAIPKRNPYIDLSAVVNDALFLFEMKSTTAANAHVQIRRAISQLYEYRYIQQVPDARLVIVIENPLPRNLGWLLDFVVTDRSLGIVWDGDGRNLHCSESQRAELGFLTQ